MFELFNLDLCLADRERCENQSQKYLLQDLCRNPNNNGKDVREIFEKSSLNPSKTFYPFASLLQKE